MPQLKDESKTLRELALGNPSFLHLQLGKGCEVGEHLVRFELDTTDPKAALAALIATDADPTAASSASAETFLPLGDVAIHEKSTVLAVKEIILSHWDQFIAQHPQAAEVMKKPESVHHIRLRDGKSSKAASGGPLRDDRVIGRCLLGLADGRRIIVQVLQEAEHIQADDLVVALRVASYEKKILSPVVDVPISRSSTVKDLYQRILTMLPHLNEVPDPALVAAAAADSAAPAASEGEAVGDEIATTLPESLVLSLAKGYTSGPALTLKSALKLKWDEPAVLREAHETALDRPPLNLRDGSVVVVRGKADFARAQAAARAKRAAAAAANTSEVEAVAGAGMAAAKARRIGSANGANRPKSRGAERGLRIRSRFQSNSSEQHSASTPSLAAGAMAAISAAASDATDGDNGLPPSPTKAETESAAASTNNRVDGSAVSPPQQP